MSCAASCATWFGYAVINTDVPWPHIFSLATTGVEMDQCMTARID